MLDQHAFILTTMQNMLTISILQKVTSTAHERDP